MTENKSEQADAENATTELDALRAMTVACPCIDGTQCNFCEMATYRDGPDLERVCIPECTNCHGSETVPRFAFMWENCPSAIRHAVADSLSVKCRECKGTRLTPRTPSDAEIEDALLEMRNYFMQRCHGHISIYFVNEIRDDTGPTEGTNPRDCRLKALVALAQEATE